MAIPRHKLVDEENACCYHLASRCARRSWLLGRDPLTGRDYSYRKSWLVDRMKALAPSFAVEIYGFAVMNNHFHLVLHYDPKACESWSDEEVARRWVEAFPPVEHGKVVEERKAEKQEMLLGDPDRLARLRRTLGSLSAFMKHLKQPIARRANLEDECGGHFFEHRFYSGALLTEEALVAAMVYVDLNPVRANQVRSLMKCRDTSAAERLRENDAAALEEYVGPLISGLRDTGGKTKPLLNVTLAAYLTFLEDIVAAETGASEAPDRVARWIARASSLRKRQRAYGSRELLREWTAERGMRLLEEPMLA